VAGAKLIDANIVVLAETHNPTIPSRDWLCNKGVFSPEDFVGEFEKQFVHTPAFATCETPHFRFFVDESRLQIGAKLSSNDVCPGSLVDKVQRYVESLPETRYTAVGFNFIHSAQFATTQDRAQFAAQRLNADGVLLAMGLERQPVEIGLILVWRDQHSRLRAVIEPKGDEENVYMAQTNVHYVVAKEANVVEAVVAHLQRFDRFREDVEGRLASLFDL